MDACCPGRSDTQLEPASYNLMLCDLIYMTIRAYIIRLGYFSPEHSPSLALMFFSLTPLTFHFFNTYLLLEMHHEGCLS